MADAKDWLAMTRHERRGALVLVVLAVTVVIAVWGVRSQNHQLTPAEQQQMRQFELLADSLQQQADSAKHASKTKAKSRTKNQGRGDIPMSPASKRANKEAKTKKKESRSKEKGKQEQSERIVPQF